MRVAVTGANGGAGRFVVQELSNAGHDVILTDVSYGKEYGNTVRRADLTDLGSALWAIRGAEVVVHLAAIAEAWGHPDHQIFRVNSTSTYNVFEAASTLGIKRVIIASSISGYGFCFAEHAFPPRYLPVDEAHPLLGQDAYALSKAVGEETAATFHRRNGMDAVCLRFPWIILPEFYNERFLAMQQNFESAARRHLWGYCDVKDAAQAVRLAVEYDGKLGFQTFLITAADHVLAPTPTLTLIRERYPDVPREEERLQGDQTAFDLRKAREVLGYEPRYSWRDHVAHERNAI